MDEILFRMPCIEKAEVRQLFNGPESFTPDSNWILGQSAEVANYFVAAGMNSRGIVGAGAIGKYLTEWILDGEPSVDMWAHGVRRFAGLHNNRRFLRDRVKEVLGSQLKLNYPRQSEFKTGRRLRTSPLHTRLEVAGGYFGETMAYERAVWFDRLGQDEDIDSDTISHRGTFGKPTWFDSVQDEYWACKERVCLIDMSSFTKFVIKYAIHTYDTLMQSGIDYGVRNAGYYAMRHLRMEKFFAYWGFDLNALTTPMECGREFRVNLEKGNFIGREALKEQKENGIKKKFVQFLLEDFDVNRDLWPWGGEPVYRNGVFAGVTTTCGYGFTLDRMVCLGYVSDFDDDGNPKLKKNMNKFVMEKDAHYQIDIGGKRFSAKAGIYTHKLAMSTVEPSSIPVPE